MKIPEIIHKLEEEKNWEADLIFERVKYRKSLIEYNISVDEAMEENFIENRIRDYDLTQSIIEILDKIDEVKIKNELRMYVYDKSCPFYAYQRTLMSKGKLCELLAKSIKQYLEGN